jgi:glycosyltransferase involved in cell wall biosynthesis
MKILVINKFFYQFGGTERYAFALTDLLESYGHETVPFAMAHPDNVISDYSKYFVSPVDLAKPRISWSGLKAAGRVVYSFEAARKLRQLIRDTKPDLAHIQNIYHQLSPSVLKVLKEEKIPTVQTLHDYAYLSPSYGLFDHGAVCERVKPRKYYRAVFHKCVKNSFMASALDAFAFRFHATFGLDERLVGRLIAPSEFVKNKFAEWGRNVFRMEVLPHFIDATRYEPEYAPGAEVAYVGRLSEEKGIGILLAAMEKIPDVRLKVIGTGPMEKQLKDFCELAGLKNVRFLGQLRHTEVMEEIGRSRFVVVPSLFYEPFGYLAIEAACMGKAVVASKVGGLPEIVRDSETGVLVPPGDAKALASAIATLAADEPSIRAFGHAGRAMVELRFRPDEYYAKLMEIYESVSMGVRPHVKR